MARNTTVNADQNAPAITEMLAGFVTSHPSRGWSDAVENEAHRTFANWAGCTIGAATHETSENHHPSGRSRGIRRAGPG
jgi:hypothetical protein